MQTIFFDFGNVIGHFDHGRALRRLLQHTDRSAEQLRSLMYANDLEIRFETGRATVEEVFAVGREHGGLTCSHEEFVDAFCDIFSHHEPMAELVAELKRSGYRLALASNTNPAHYSKFRVMFADVLQHFDAIVVSHEVGARKPHAEFFERADRVAGAQRDRSLFIDDLADNVHAARAHGWQAIQYRQMDELRAELRRLGVRLER